MNYKKLTNDELRRYPYPNLIAELTESGYSICTLSEWLGFGRYRKENDIDVWKKLKGEQEITAEEALSLTKLFGVDITYLFSHELRTISGKSAAFWRWYESNQKKEEEMRQFKAKEYIIRKMKEKPYLLEVFEALAEMSQQELNKVFIQYRIGGAVNE